MIVTPWGDSETLRAGMLPPGPGNSSQAVAANQRRRLYGAMVASVAARGYESTRVSDLTELSGVSLRSFYDLFADKEDCFVAVIESLVGSTLQALMKVPGVEDWAVDSRRRLRSAATLMAAQPMAAKICLVEAYVAGGRAAAAVDGAVAQVESVIRKRLATSPIWSDLPPELATFGIAGFLEVSVSRLIGGRPQEIPALADSFVDLLLGYRAPTRPLRSAARSPDVRPEELEASDHAERALRAFEALLTRQRYMEMTMEQVAKRAKMSVRTLYANFSSREDLMLAAIDSAGAQVVAATQPAYRRGSTPPEGIRRALGALFRLLASRPNLAHLLLHAAYEGGETALERRTEALRPLEGLFTKGVGYRLAIDRALFSEAMLTGLIGLARRRLAEGGPAALPALATVSTYVALTPLLGVEAGTAAAEGKSYRRDPANAAEAVREAIRPPGSERVMVALARGPLDVAGIAAATFIPVQEVARLLVHLEEAGIVEAAETGGRTLYRSHWPLMDTEEWGHLPRTERERQSAEIGWSIKGEIDEAVEAGTFDARPERTLIRYPVWVDEEGWRELSETLDKTLKSCFTIQDRVRDRLAKSGDPAEGFPARVLLVSFEMPPPEA